jgi:RNA polymerase sigma factor for flagellar operon FliA
MNHTLCPAQLEASLPTICALARSLKRERNVPLQLDELVHAGVLGLAEAASRFDSSTGHALMTFAYWRIRGAMLDAVANAAPVRRSAWRAGFQYPLSLEAARRRGQGASASAAPMEDLLDRRRIYDALANAMNELSSDERRLVFMHYIENRTLSDIGRELGVSRSWMSRLHSRMIVKLREMMRGDSALAAA